MSEKIGLLDRLRIARPKERRENGDILVHHATLGRVECDSSKCTGCRLCVKACPGGALEMDGLKNVRLKGDHAACIACGDCAAICTPYAITITRAMTYEGFYRHVGRGDLIPPRRF